MEQEGYPINSPPVFNSDHIGWWKNRMRVYLESVDPQLWDIIETGPLKITKLDDNGAQVEKPSNRNNARARLALRLARVDDEYLRDNETAKEVWDALFNFQEGSIGYGRKTMIRFQIWRQLHMFRMEEDETIKEMFFRFLTIVNNLAALGEEVSVLEQVSTIIECLPRPKYRLLVTILWGKGLDNLSMNELFNKLLVHERELNRDKDPYIVHYKRCC